MMQQRLAERLETAEMKQDRRNELVSRIIDSMDRFVEEYDSDVTAQLRTTSAHSRNEFLALLARHTIDRAAGEFSQLIAKDETETQAKQAWTIRRIAESNVSVAFSDIVSGVRSPRTADPETLALLRRLYAERQERPEDLLLQTEEAEARSLRIDDIDAVGNLYGQYWLSDIDLIKMIQKKRLKEKERTFLRGFYEPGQERDTMESMMQATDELMKRRRSKRREKATMHGTGLWGKRGELLGVAIHTLGPSDPALDPDYLNDARKQVEYGKSGPGGVMQYPLASDKEEFRQALESGRNAQLFLVIGKVRGAALRVMTENIRQMRRAGVLRPDDDFLTYYMRTLRTACNGVIMDAELDAPGQNVGSGKFLSVFGYRDGMATDEHPDPSPDARRSFMAGEDRWDIWPGWMHMAAKYRNIMESVRAHRHWHAPHLRDGK